MPIAALAALLLVPATAAAQVRAPDEPPSAPAPAAAPADDPARPLRQGDSGPRVRQVQRALGLRADGVYGERTRSAVRRHQRRSGLPVTGEVDAATALGLSMRAPVLVRRVQRALKARPTGRVTAALRARVRSAERAAGLPSDGEIDPRLLVALGIPVPAPAVTGAPAPAPAQPPTPAAVPGPPAGAAAWVAAARSRIGAPYGAGAAGPDRFDCSGLIVWALARSGVTVPRSSFEQYGLGTAVERAQIQAGDLVFFDTAGPGASDVGIATSPTQVVSATTHGVMEHAVQSGYWAEHYVGARRL